MRVCAAEQAMVFKVLVLNRVYNFTIKRLEQGVFLDWKPFSNSVNTCDERPTFAIQIIFFLNIYFHDFSAKNYLILYAKQS